MTAPDTFPFYCPACDQLMIAEFSDVSELVDCLGCGREVQIPEPSPDPLVPSLGLLPEEIGGATMVEGFEAPQAADPAAPTFEFPCPGCAAALMAYRQDASQPTQCPYCEHHLRIPDPPSAAGAPLAGADADDEDSDWLDAQSDAAWDFAAANVPGSQSAETKPIRHAVNQADGAEADDEDEEAAELLAALREDTEAVKRMKRKPRTDSQPQSDSKTSSSNEQASDPTQSGSSQAKQEAGSDASDASAAASSEGTAAGSSSSVGAASAQSPAETTEQLDKEAVRSLHRWLLKFARSAAAHPQARDIVVYKAKESEAPVRFALVLKAEPMTAVAFTAAHVLVSFPEEKQLRLLKPERVKVQAKFRKASAGDAVGGEAKAGLARVRLSEKSERKKPEACAEVRFEFEAESTEERSALRLRSLLQNWMSAHPVLSAAKE